MTSAACLVTGYQGVLVTLQVAPVNRRLSEAYKWVDSIGQFHDFPNW
jgi:hypothetical protein